MPGVAGPYYPYGPYYPPYNPPTIWPQVQPYVPPIYVGDPPPGSYPTITVNTTGMSYVN